MVVHVTARRRRRPLFAGVLAVGLGGTLLVGSFLVSSTVSGLVRARPSPVATTPIAPDVVDGSVSKTDRSIGALQERLRQHGDDQKSQTELGLAYLQKARETADPTYYTRADGLQGGLVSHSSAQHD